MKTNPFFWSFTRNFIVTLLSMVQKYRKMLKLKEIFLTMEAELH